MLSSIIKHIHQTPEALRVRYLFVSVALSGMFVVLLWVFSFRESIGIILKNDSVEQTIENLSGNKNFPATEIGDSLESLIHTGQTLQEGLLSGMQENDSPPKNPYEEDVNTKNTAPQEDFTASEAVLPEQLRSDTAESESLPLLPTDTAQ